MFEIDHPSPLIDLSAEALVDVVRRDLRDVVGEVAGQVELAQLRHGALLLVVVAQLLVHGLRGETCYLLISSPPGGLPCMTYLKGINFADRVGG